MKIIGEVTSDEELYLDGDLDGKLVLRNRLTVGPNSKVNANIKAQEIIVFGTIKGNVESESRVSLRTGASIVGDIKTAGIVIEDGAYFKGGIDISKNGENSRNGETKAPKAQGASAGLCPPAAHADLDGLLRRSEYRWRMERQQRQQ